MKLTARRKKTLKRPREFSADVLFSHVKDDYGTPQLFYDDLNDEFHFIWDFAADTHNRKAPAYLGPDRKNPRLRDALAVSWMTVTGGAPGFFNPPYSKIYGFLKKAAHERREGQLSVGLIPARTDTKYWHQFVWNKELHRPRKGIEIRFPQGRLKFTIRLTDAERKEIKDIWGMIPQLPQADKKIAKKLGLPVQIVRAVVANKPEVVTSAPFPNVIVVFRPDTRKRQSLLTQ